MNFNIPDDFIYYNYLNTIDENIREKHILDLLKFAIDNNYAAVNNNNELSPTDNSTDNESDMNQEYVILSEPIREIKTEMYKIGLDVSNLTSLLGSGTKRGKVAETVLTNNLFKNLLI